MSAREEFEKWFEDYRHQNAGHCVHINRDMLAAYQAGLEAAAKVCDEQVDCGTDDDSDYYNFYQAGCDDSAEAIRKLKDA